METEVSKPETPVEVSNEQVESFFKSGGEEAPKVEEKAEVKPEAKAEAKPEIKEDKVEKVVPLAALHEERQKRKELQQQMQQDRERILRMEQVFQRMQQPEKETDPVKQLSEKTEKLEQKLTEQERGQEYQRYIQSLVTKYQASAEAFSKEQPDFGNAYKFLISQRQEEYVAAGYTREQAKQFVEQDEIAIVDKAYKDEVNPGERIYNIAKSRGYQKEVPKEKEEKTVEQIEKGLQANKTLSNASGKTQTTMTLESLLELEGAEFDKAWEKLVTKNLK